MTRCDDIRNGRRGYVPAELNYPSPARGRVDCMRLKIMPEKNRIGGITALPVSPRPQVDPGRQDIINSVHLDLLYFPGTRLDIGLSLSPISLGVKGGRDPHPCAQVYAFF